MVEFERSIILMPAGSCFRNVRRFADRFNLAALDPNHLIGGVVPRAHIENFSGMNGDAGWARGFRFLRNGRDRGKSKHAKKNCKLLHERLPKFAMPPFLAGTQRKLARRIVSLVLRCRSSKFAVVQSGRQQLLSLDTHHSLCMIMQCVA